MLSADIPGICVLRILGEHHILPCDRMGKADFMRPEGNLAGILLLGVLPLTHQRHTAAGELHTDLVGSAGAKQHTDPGYSIPAAEKLLIQNRFLNTLGRGLGDHCHFSGFVTVEKVH